MHARRSPRRTSSPVGLPCRRTGAAAGHRGRTAGWTRRSRLGGTTRRGARGPPRRRTGSVRTWRANAQPRCGASESCGWCRCCSRVQARKVLSGGAPSWWAKRARRCRRHETARAEGGEVHGRGTGGTVRVGVALPAIAVVCVRELVEHTELEGQDGRQLPRSVRVLHPRHVRPVHGPQAQRRSPLQPNRSSNSSLADVAGRARRRGGLQVPCGGELRDHGPRGVAADPPYSGSGCPISRSGRRNPGSAARVAPDRRSRSAPAATLFSE